MPEAAIVNFDPKRRRRTTARKRAPKAVPAGDPLGLVMDSWELALRSRGRTDGSIAGYRGTVETFVAWLAENGYPDDVEAIEPEHVRRFLAHENGRPIRSGPRAGKPTTPAHADRQYRGLKALFSWAMDEELRTTSSPVLKADRPKVPVTEKPPLSDEDIVALLATCKPRTFWDLRDEAIMRLFIDSGPRLSGVTGLRYTPDNPETHDIDLKRYRVRITLKGGDVEWIPVGKKTAIAIDRYIRVRARHRLAELPDLWLGKRGRLADSGVEQMLHRRGDAAEVPGVHPHRFRRTSATAFLNAGGTETDAMHIYGWKSPDMVRHYTKETARERARDAHARLSPGDRF